MRGALARRIELAFCESEVQPSARVRGALHMVRIGRLRKLKLLYLLDMEDCGTPDDPLKQFALLKEGADTLFARALSRLLHVWILCTPSDVAAVTRFCGRLGTYVAESRANNASWQALSTFIAKVMRRVDETAERYSLQETTVARASPSCDLIDLPTKYQQALQASISKTTATKAA